MSSEKKQDWLQGQFDKAAADKEAEDHISARKADRRRKCKVVFQWTFLFILIGIGVAWFGFREESKGVIQQLTGIDLDAESDAASSDEEASEGDSSDDSLLSGYKRAVDKAKGTVDGATARAEKRDAILESMDEE